MAENLTFRDAMRLGDLCRAIQRNATVRRGIHSDSGEMLIMEGVIRSIVDRDGNYAIREEDIRDCYLRIMLISGFEAFWPVAEIIRDIEDNNFYIKP